MIEKKLSAKALDLWVSILWSWYPICVLLTLLLGSVEWIAVVYVEVGILLIFVISHLYMKGYHKRFRVTYDDQELIVYSGIWWQKRVVVPFNRITNFNTIQGPWQRKRQLATLKIETAGQSGQTTPEVQLWSQDNYDELLDDLKSRLKSGSSKEMKAVDKDAKIESKDSVVELLTKIEWNTRPQ